MNLWTGFTYYRNIDCTTDSIQLLSHHRRRYSSWRRSFFLCLRCASLHLHVSSTDLFHLPVEAIYITKKKDRRTIKRQADINCHTETNTVQKHQTERQHWQKETDRNWQKWIDNDKNGQRISESDRQCCLWYSLSIFVMNRQWHRQTLT